MFLPHYLSVFVAKIKFVLRCRRRRRIHFFLEGFCRNFERARHMSKSKNCCLRRKSHLFASECKAIEIWLLPPYMNYLCLRSRRGMHRNSGSKSLFGQFSFVYSQWALFAKLIFASSKILFDTLLTSSRRREGTCVPSPPLMGLTSEPHRKNFHL